MFRNISLRNYANANTLGINDRNSSDSILLHGAQTFLDAGAFRDGDTGRTHAVPNSQFERIYSFGNRPQGDISIRYDTDRNTASTHGYLAAVLVSHNPGNFLERSIFGTAFRVSRHDFFDIHNLV